MLLHNLQRGPSLEMHLPEPRRLIVVGEKSVRVVVSDDHNSSADLQQQQMQMETEFENVMKE